MLDGIFSKICLVMGVVMVGMVVYIHTLHLRLDVCEVTHEAVALVGNAQEAQTKAADKTSAVEKKVIDETVTKHSDTLKSDNERVRKQITRSSVLPKSPQVCTGGDKDTEVSWPDADAAIRDYRQSVRELIEEGSQAEIDMNAVRDWLVPTTA